MIDEDLDQDNKSEHIQDYSRKKRRGSSLLGIILIILIIIIAIYGYLYIYPY